MDKKREIRLAKNTLKRLGEAGLDRVEDPRRVQGRRWTLASLLGTVVVALMAGSRSLADVEDFTESMSPAMRRRLGLRGRVPDTTLRDVLCRLVPSRLRRVLHAVTRAALRRKALGPINRLPFGVVAMDGKVTALPTVVGKYVQKQSSDDHERGLMRTFTSCLVSAAGRPCIDVYSVPRTTNEMGGFERALCALLSAYPKRGRPFRLLSYDAGACSLANAELIVDEDLDYLFSLKGGQPTLLAEAERLLARRHTPDEVEQRVRGGRMIECRLFLDDEMAGWMGWDHLATVLRVQSVELGEDGSETVLDERYFLSSLPAKALERTQWLQVVRAHWGVENNCHHTFDTVFAEDDRPWITADGQGAFNVLILRRVAYTLLTLFRSVTQRSPEHRLIPWRQLVRAVHSFCMRLELLLPHPTPRLPAFP